MIRSEVQINKPSRQGYGCVALFALPFAAVGVLMTYLIFSNLIEWQQMQSWEQVPVTITQLDLDRSSGSKSTTYRVKATYRYTYGGQEYTGERVGLSSGSDNIGSYQKNAYERLKPYHSGGKPFDAQVNPANPSEAILLPELRAELIGFYTLFAVAFGGVGWGLLVGMFIAAREDRYRRALQERYPTEPWRHRRDWEHGVIRSSSKTMMIAAFAFAILWNTISAPCIFLLPNEVFVKENYVAAIGFIFPLVGLGLIYWAATAYLRWRRYGGAVLRLDSQPVSPGGALKGTMSTGAALTAQQPKVALVLECVRKERYRSGGKSRTVETSLVRKEAEATAANNSFMSDGASVAVSFDIPADAPMTTTDGGDTEIVWKLNASVDQPGVDFSAEFEIPVFKKNV